jgi:uncharacterized repeat protein (TIGR03833 family)
MDYQIITGGNSRYYRIKRKKTHLSKNTTTKADVSRISCAEYDNPKTNPNIGRIIPKKKDKVVIIVKPYKEFKCITGIVQDVLTRKPIHTRGHKVRLTTGIIGRTLKILKK